MLASSLDWDFTPPNFAAHTAAALNVCYPVARLPGLSPFTPSPQTSQWNDAARDAARDDYAPRRSASPRGATPPRRERSPARNDDRDFRRERSPPRGDSFRGRPAPGADNPNPGNNLHISGLSLKTTEQDLEDIFAKYGKLNKVQVMYDPHTREPRGFAFVTYDNNADAEAAVEGANGTELLGRSITVAKARRGRARTPTPGRYCGPPKKDDIPPRGYGAYGPPGGYGPPRGYGGPPPARDYPPGDYPPRDYPPRDYPPRGYGPPPVRGYDDYPPPRRGGYDDPPPPRRAYDDLPPPRSRYDDAPPPRSRYDDLPPPRPRY